MINDLDQAYSVEFPCPNCGEPISASPDRINNQGRITCPNCKKLVIVDEDARKDLYLSSNIDREDSEYL